MVQQQAVRDFGQAMANFFARTHRRPAWRKSGRDEGFRIVSLTTAHVRRLNSRSGRARAEVRLGSVPLVPSGPGRCEILPGDP
jgi:hypothetical protein